MTSNFCSSCGTVVQLDKKFCAVCGAPIRQADNAVPAESQQQASQTAPPPNAPQWPAGQPAPHPNATQWQASQPAPPPNASQWQASQPVPPLNAPQPVYPNQQVYVQQPAPAQQQVYAGQPTPAPAYAQAAYAPAPPKKSGKKVLIIIGSIFGAFILGIILIVVIAFSALSSTANADYYKLGNDQIPSINQVVGKRSVFTTATSTSNGVTTRTVGYKDVEDPTEDLTEYLIHLINNEDFIVTAEYNTSEVVGSAQLGKESADSGKIILLDIEFNENGYTLVFTKCEGTLTAN